MTPARPVLSGEINVFAGVLILQSLPFLSAVAIALLENSRINDFAFWRNARIHTAELIGIRPVAIRRQIAGAPPLQSDSTRDVTP